MEAPLSHVLLQEGVGTEGLSQKEREEHCCSLVRHCLVIGVCKVRWSSLDSPSSFGKFADLKEIGQSCGGILNSKIPKDRIILSKYSAWLLTQSHRWPRYQTSFVCTHRALIWHKLLGIKVSHSPWCVKTEVQHVKYAQGFSCTWD